MTRLAPARPAALHSASRTGVNGSAMTNELPAAEVASPRAQAAKTVVGGLVAVGVSLGLVVLASALGWQNVQLSGTLLLLGWVYLGFGVGELVFAGRFRVVSMLLAVLFGFGGMLVSFGAIHRLGFQ